VGKYAKTPRLQLRGCENDVAGLGEVLRTTLAFDSVASLINEQATADAIIAALHALADIVRPEDSFVFYFSGNGFLRDDVAVFGSYDLDPDPDPQRAVLLTEGDIDACMSAIPARDKLLITDACHLAPPELAPPLEYRYLFSCRRGETAYEGCAHDGSPRGAFTYALECALRSQCNAPLEQLLSQITASLPSTYEQTPGFTGSGAGTFVRDSHPAFEVIDLDIHGSSARFSTRQLAELTSWMQANEITAKPLWLDIGRAWLAKGSCDAAITALSAADRSKASLPLVRSQLLAGAYRDALDSLQWFKLHPGEHSDQTHDRSLGELLSRLERMSQARGHALLVGVGATTPEAWTSDPCSLLAPVRAALDRAGFSDVTILRDPGRADLLAAFELLVARSGDAPAFFLYVGPGFEDTELWLSSADEAADYFSDLPVSSLQQRLAGCENFTSAILLTQLRGPRRSGERGNLAPPAGLAGLGSSTIVATPPKLRDLGDLELGPPPPELQRLFAALEQFDGAISTLSAKDWLVRASVSEGVTIRGDGASPVFSFGAGLRAALEHHRLIELAPLRAAEKLLTRLTQDPAFAASAWLHRGAVRSELGRYDEALEDITAAFDRYHADHRAKGKCGESSPSDVRWPEAHYHRGRILFAAGRYLEAVAELAIALDQDGRHARAHYYSVRAIRRLIEANLEERAHESAQRYVALGAPLGLDDIFQPLVGAVTSSHRDRSPLAGEGT